MNLVLFDVCGTLIDGNSTQLYVDYLLENGPVNFRAKHYKRWKPFFSLIAWIFRKVFHLDITRLIIRKCFSGIKQEEITNLNKKFSSFYLKKLKNHIHEKIRKQKSKKRKLDRQPYEEVSEIGHRLKSKELFLDELVAFREAIDNYKRTLDDVGLDNYQRLMSNERFKGRRAMLKDLKNHLKDFQDNTIL